VAKIPACQSTLAGDPCSIHGGGDKPRVSLFSDTQLFLDGSLSKIVLVFQFGYVVGARVMLMKLTNR
jgi:hypothetical protein